MSEPADNSYPPSWEAWSIVALLLVLNIVSLMDRQLLSLLAVAVQNDLKLSDVQLGLLQGLAFALFHAVMALLLGWAVDRYSRRIVIFWGIITWSLSCAAGGLASGFAQLFASRLGVGAGEAVMQPAGYSLIRDLLPPARRVAGFGVFGMGSSLGVGVSYGFGGSLVASLMDPNSILAPLGAYFRPWQSALILAGLPGVALAFLVLLIREPARRGGAPARGPFFSPLVACARRYGTMLPLLMLGFALTTLCSYCLFAWTPVYLDRQFGWDTQAVGYGLAISLGLIPASGFLIGGAIVDRFFMAGRRDILLLLPMALMSVGAVMAVLAFQASSPYAFLGMLGVIAFTVSALTPCAFASLQLLAPADLRGRITGAFMVVQNFVGAAGGPLIVALITEHVLHDRDKVGTSVAITVVTAGAIAVLLFASILRPFKAAIAHVDAD